ncbi:helix-turn-helix domain-containing protein [Staphylococcus simulans]|uniref:helix-turn-helix domain-containing protein n=1 Tax=Staphylococcus simulans TaxID=1286 RepID=UPI000D0457FB|nr:helix-turn-helix transcriptional regulator [Staphylococcus simulans]
MLADTLKKLRMNHKLTQQEVANALHIANTTYAGYEQNHRTPDLRTLIKIADWYHVSLDELIGRSNSSASNSFIQLDIDNSDDWHHLNQNIQEKIKRNLTEYTEFLIEKKLNKYSMNDIAN